MGLDITFSREAAIAAGIQFKDIPNGSPADIQDAIDIGAAQDYLEWLREVPSYIAVPTTDFFVIDDSGDPTRICVRANRWGRTYHPLTEWLRLHNIEWTES
jgi:hypothetical protein